MILVAHRSQCLGPQVVSPCKLGRLPSSSSSPQVALPCHSTLLAQPSWLRASVWTIVLCPPQTGRARGVNLIPRAQSHRVTCPGLHSELGQGCSGNQASARCLPGNRHPEKGHRRGKDFQESRGTDFKGQSKSLLLSPSSCPPGPLNSLLRNPKHTLSLGCRWKPLIVPRGREAARGRPSSWWGRSGTVWLWLLLDTSISDVNYGLVSRSTSRSAAPLPHPAVVTSLRGCVFGLASAHLRIKGDLKV